MEVFDNSEKVRLISNGLYVLKRIKSGSENASEYGAFYRAHDFPRPYPFSTQQRDLVRQVIGSSSQNVEGVARFLSSSKGEDWMDAMNLSTIYFERYSSFPEIDVTEFKDVYRFEDLTFEEKERFAEGMYRRSIVEMVA